MKKKHSICLCLMIFTGMVFAQGKSESTTAKKTLVVAVQSLPQSSIQAMAEILQCCKQDRLQHRRDLGP